MYVGSPVEVRHAFQCEDPLKTFVLLRIFHRLNPVWLDAI
jgi:hypothetical protein